ncbi:MAG: EscT/YscT/HrcT family type III secretion system export apparatus protein [Flavobacteriales bacterium]|nr:EscT/YscT/HrcT family type III secretion system export apparatus protein [Flavobacteriales bacterium]
MSRVLPIFLFIPFFSNTTLANMTIRGTFIVIFCMPLTGAITLPEEGIDTPFISMFYEFIVGLFIAIPAALPFWISNTIGEVIDNQRGATLSNSIDPSVGVESSPFSSFFLFYTNVLYLTSPGILLLIQSIYMSYETFPFSQQFDILTMNYDLIYSLIDTSLISGVIFVLPVLFFMFLTEVFLGILSRFSPQMNTFSLSLTIKSFIGISVLFVYFETKYMDYIMRYFTV